MPVDLEALSAAGAQILGDLGWRKRPAQRLQDAAFLALEAAGSTPQVRATVACAAARAILEDALGEEAPDFADTTVLDEALSFLLFVAANVLAAKAAPGELSTAIREAAAAQAAFRSASRSPAPSNHPSNHPSHQGSQKEDDAHLVAALRRLGLQPPVVGKRVRKQPSADPPPPPKRAPPKRTKDDDYDDNGDNDDEDEDEFDEEGDEEEEADAALAAHAVAGDGSDGAPRGHVLPKRLVRDPVALEEAAAWAALKGGADNVVAEAPVAAIEVEPVAAVVADETVEAATDDDTPAPPRRRRPTKKKAEAAVAAAGEDAPKDPPDVVEV